jgi:hypothetical protein
VVRRPRLRRRVDIRGSGDSDGLLLDEYLPSEQADAAPISLLTIMVSSSRPGPPPDTWPLARPPLPSETNLPGVLAAGDVRYGSIERVAAAVGEGSVAVGSVHQYLTTTAPVTAR